MALSPHTNYGFNNILFALLKHLLPQDHIEFPLWLELIVTILRRLFITADGPPRLSPTIFPPLIIHHLGFNRLFSYSFSKLVVGHFWVFFLTLKRFFKKYPSGHKRRIESYIKVKYSPPTPQNYNSNKTKEWEWD